MTEHTEIEIVIGIGCQRGITRATLEHAIDSALKALATVRVRSLASHAHKASEPALLELSAQRGWPLRCYPAHTLATITIPNPSTLVADTVGTPSVAEAAALCASNGGALLVAKQLHRGTNGKSVTIAAARWIDPSARRR